MYVGKVPTYSSLKASKGTVFFLPLPMAKTLEMLEEVTGDYQCPLPSPELYIMVSGKPSKERVVWRTIVNVDAVKAAVQKLKQINWLCRKVNEQSVDDVAKQVVQTVDTTTSTICISNKRRRV